jgi:hypothetical protein
MKFEKDRPGYAFEDDYPESYGPVDTARLRAIVPQQVGQLGAAGAAQDAQLLGILMGRRCANGQRAQVESRARRDGSLYLVARGEVLLPGSDVGRVRQLFAGFEQHGTVSQTRPSAPVRMRPKRVGPSQVDEVVYECAASRVTASPNYLATMAAVSKGVGGAEPAPPPPPPPAPNTLAAAGPEPAAATADSGPAGSSATGSGPTAGGPGAVRVAIIDTGIPQQRRTDGRLNITRTASNIDELDVLPAGPDGLLDYQAGHGTFVAGIIERVAPHAEIRMYRAADTDGFSTDDDVATAILQAHDDGAQVINLSLGIRTLDDQPPPATAAAVATVVRESGGRTVIVAAAGNFGDQSKVFPAALPGVEAVAGLTAYLSPAEWSNYGDDIAFSTVAEGVHSTFVKGQESPVFDPSPDNFGTDAWAVWSGTSFAAPQIAGAVARVSYEENIDVRAAAEKLAEYGKEIAGFGKAMRILQGIG